MTERLALARLPTPVQHLSRLSEREGVDLWVKRDDLTGLGLSGNKVRKLEYLLAGAAAAGVDTVITTGGLQSNHCRATAVACRQLGMQPVLLLRGVAPVVADGNALLDQLLGAQCHYCTPEQYRDERDARMEQLADAVRARGGTPLVIPEGGSNAVGSRGYIRAAAELASQVSEPFDAIVVTAAPDHVPQPLVEQLKPGGRLVIPVGGGDVQRILVVRRTAEGSTTKAVLPVRFVPMTGEAQRRSAPSQLTRWRWWKQI